MRLLLFCLVTAFLASSRASAGSYADCSKEQQRCLHGCGDGQNFSRACGERCEEALKSCNQDVSAARDEKHDQSEENSCSASCQKCICCSTYEGRKLVKHCGCYDGAKQVPAC